MGIQFFISLSQLKCVNEMNGCCTGASRGAFQWDLNFKLHFLKSWNTFKNSVTQLKFALEPLCFNQLDRQIVLSFGLLGLSASHVVFCMQLLRLYYVLELAICSGILPKGFYFINIRQQFCPLGLRISLPDSLPD